MSVVASVVDQKTGTETKRLVNKSRWKGYGPATILYADPSVSAMLMIRSYPELFHFLFQVPPSPPSVVAAVVGDVDQRIRALLVQVCFFSLKFFVSSINALILEIHRTPYLDSFSIVQPV